MVDAIQTLAFAEWETFVTWALGATPLVFGPLYIFRRHSLADREKHAPVRRQLTDDLQTNVEEIIKTIGTINVEKPLDDPAFNNIYADFWRTKRAMEDIFYGDVLKKVEIVEASLKKLHRLRSSVVWWPDTASQEDVEQYTNLVNHIYLAEVPDLVSLARNYYGISTSRTRWFDWRLYFRP
ncbi:hypothetical protein [uncultured Sneathiella sp.]|jgi:hypothetical protein|uniref:hypothetical protein n=1 Tax=uncultured Sneathiella sp. TaxID=879315 RepID=UPI0030EB58E6|tara:strand:- start:1267 stop:1809 length:543 start_codon:yes stop_codon:yes gene_type:complete